MERQDMDDEQEEHTIGSLDTSMDRYLEHHGLWRKRIPQGFKRKFVFFFVLKFVWCYLDGSSLFRAVSEDVRINK
jgi:hypothetical protein